jgi:mRNA interferase MazF
MKGDIVFVRFQYTDLSIIKPRPALVLHEERDEVVLAYISSRVPIIPSGTDVLVLRIEPYFEATGLKRDSVIIVFNLMALYIEISLIRLCIAVISFICWVKHYKLSVLTTLKNWFIEGLFGEADETLRLEINAKLASCYRL